LPQVQPPIGTEVKTGGEGHGIEVSITDRFNGNCWGRHPAKRQLEERYLDYSVMLQRDCQPEYSAVSAGVVSRLLRSRLVDCHRWRCKTQNGNPCERHRIISVKL
jgi:hypothetical protein